MLSLDDDEMRTFPKFSNVHTLQVLQSSPLMENKLNL